MKLVDIPTEQTTAITDGILAIIAFGATVYLKWISKRNCWKMSLWICFFYLLSTASVLGAIAHGLQLSKIVQDIIWCILYLSLGLMISVFMVAALCDLFGEKRARRVLPVMVTIGVVFFIITTIWSDSFVVFIIYEAVIMFFALGSYIWLSYSISYGGGWYMAVGILISIMAAIFQTFNSISFTIVWPFDHNGVYHIIQIVGLFFIIIGLRKALICQQ